MPAVPSQAELVVGGGRGEKQVKTMIKILLCAIALCALPELSHAALPCAKYPDAVNILKTEWGETLAFVGVGEAGEVEVFINPDAPTWTILVVNKNGIACQVFSGSKWFSSPRRLQPPTSRKAPNRSGP